MTPCPEACGLEAWGLDVHILSDEECPVCENTGYVLPCLGCDKPVAAKHLPICATCRDETNKVLDATFGPMPPLCEGIRAEMSRIDNEP